jgi:signal peptidase II
MKYLYFFIISSMLILFDRLTKYFILKNLKFGESIKIIGEILKFEKVENRGGVFGIFPQGRYFFIIISIVALFIIFIIFIKLKLESKIIIFLLSLIFSGIFGNLIDRIFYGYVIDFISIKNFPVFNLSDSYITIGVILILLFLWKKEL